MRLPPPCGTRWCRRSSSPCSAAPPSPRSRSERERRRRAARSPPRSATSTPCTRGCRCPGTTSADKRAWSTATAIKTTADGRARVRLDDATLVVVDGSTEATLQGGSCLCSPRAALRARRRRSHAEVVDGRARAPPSRPAPPPSTPAPAAARRRSTARAESSSSPRPARPRTWRRARPRRSPRPVSPWRPRKRSTTGRAGSRCRGRGRPVRRARSLPSGAAARGDDPGSALVVRSAVVGVDHAGRGRGHPHAHDVLQRHRSLRAGRGTPRAASPEPSSLASRAPTAASPRSTRRCTAGVAAETPMRAASSGRGEAGCAARSPTSPPGRGVAPGRLRRVAPRARRARDVPLPHGERRRPGDRR